MTIGFWSFWSIFYKKITLYHLQVDIWILVHDSTPLFVRKKPTQNHDKAIFFYVLTFFVPFTAKFYLKNYVSQKLSYSLSKNNEPINKCNVHMGQKDKAPLKKTYFCPETVLFLVVVKNENNGLFKMFDFNQSFFLLNLTPGKYDKSTYFVWQ